MKKMTGVLSLLCFVVAVSGCQSNPTPVSIKKIPIVSMEGVLTQSGVSFDKAISSDGNGSLKIETTKPVTVRLFELRDITIENARLLYQAHLKTSNLSGQAYLEMWCVFPGLGEYFSRGLHAPLTGTVDWTTQEIPFFLQKGQKPELIKLNVVVNGQGTVWIDDIELTKGPFK